MRPLSGPSEAQRAKNGKFTQSYWPIVAAGRQSGVDTQLIPQDLLQDLLQVTAGEPELGKRSSSNGRKQYITD